MKKGPDGGVNDTKMDAAARVLRLRLQHFEVKNTSGFATAFATAKKDNAGAVLLVESPRAVANRVLIAELGIKHRLPIMSQFSRVVEAGGFMSYGIDWQDIGRRIAGATDQILKGKNPNDIPIQQPTAFHLSINLKTAKTLGILPTRQQPAL